jgi:PHD/YefM family antitoxin component YafN of YafNO toxin-antitoxin module
VTPWARPAASAGRGCRTLNACLPLQQPAPAEPLPAAATATGEPATRHPRARRLGSWFPLCAIWRGPCSPVGMADPAGEPEGEGTFTDDTRAVTISVMKEIGAAELRQSLGRLARRLERDGEPVLLKLGRRPVGVIVSVQDFNERFSLQKAAAERAALVEQIGSARSSPSRGRPTSGSCRSVADPHC